MSIALKSLVSPEDLANAAGIPVASVRSQIAGGRLRLVEGYIPRSDCIRYLAELGIELAAELAAELAVPVAPVPAAPARDYDPEDPEWSPGCDTVRMSWVCDQLAKVVAPRIIVRELMTRGLSRARAESYLRQAYSELTTLGQIGAENRRDQYRDALAEVLHECLADVPIYDREGNPIDSGPRDLRTAARILDQLVKLDGGYPAQRVQLSGHVDGGAGAMTGQAAPDAIRARLAAYMSDPVLMAKARGEDLPVENPESVTPQGGDVADENQEG